LDLFPKKVHKDIDILIVAMDDICHDWGFEVVYQLRQNGIASDLYPEPAKIKKQMNYANARKVPFVAIIGTSELEQRRISLKNMTDGTQETLSMDELIGKFLDGK
jgi:histidyl-tRNA synthetase